LAQAESAVILPETDSAGEVWRILARAGFWRCLSAAVLLYLFVEVAIRAGRQSITGDEAYNYFLYLRGTLGNVFFANYDTNNHVLYTVLAWLSSHWLGLNEFNLRIPSVASAALYFITVFRIASFLFHRKLLHTLAAILLAGNPYVLDFFTVARGYGLALAFFALAVLNVFVIAREKTASDMHLLRAGMWCAVAVAANLGLLFPVCGLFVGMAGALSRTGTRNLKEFLAILARIVQFSFGPFLVFAFCFLVMPLHSAHRDSFYFGAESWPHTIESLVTPSLFHNLRAPLLARWPTFFWSMVGAVETWFIPALAFLSIAFTIVLLFRRRDDNPALLVSGVTFTATICILAFVHAALDVKLPIMRTGIYFLLLLPLTLLAFICSQRRSVFHWAGNALIPIFVFWAALYVPQWTARATADWRYDASTRDFAKAIETLRVYSGATNIRVGGSWIFEPALNFYRQKFGYTQWQPVPRNSKLTDSADYYVISANDRQAVSAEHLRVILDDKVSGAVLAVGGQPYVR
jgi:hypothetical protein